MVRFNTILNLVDNLVQRVAGYVPFSVRNIVWRNLDKMGESILDVGCGKGQPMKFINRHGEFYTVGVDIFEPSLLKCKEDGVYDDYILADVRMLPFRVNSFDIVLCLEVVEHVGKEEGMKLIKEMEKIACRQVVISTPVGIFKQSDPDSKANPYQKHKAAWLPIEFGGKGYKVRGSGVYQINEEDSLLSRFPLKPLGYLIYVLAGPFVYFFPKISCHMVCTKKPSKVDSEKIV